MSGKNETWSERLAAVSATAAAAEGQESIPAVEDDNIEGAMAWAESEREQGHEEAGKPHGDAVADDAPQSDRAGSDTTQALAGGHKPFTAVIAAAVATGVQHDIPDPPTMGSIQPEAQELTRRRMREAGITPTFT